MPKLVNPNLQFLCDSLYNCKRGVILSGSSRSGKTYSCVDFIVYLCAKVETNCTINIIKETYRSFKTTLYDDFNRRLPDYGLSSPFQNRQEVSTFKIFGSKINLLGADSESVAHGVSCDYFYINEALDVSKAIFDQAEMRCRKMWFIDFNPKFTDHWVYSNVQQRPDVGFLKTTFKDNPFVSEPEKRKILSYEPTEENLHQGTADQYLWKVYGLGEAAAPEGLIFQNIKFIDHFPENIENIYYGMDFGYTMSPSTLVKVGILGGDMFIKYCFYEPTNSPNELIPLVRQVITNETVWSDPSGESGGRGMISECRRVGLNVYASNSFPGSIKYGIGIMKKYKIHVVDDVNSRREFTNYRHSTVKQGGHVITLDEPIDDFNHGIDAARMACIMNRL